MPYKEIGTFQDFSAWEAITPTEYAVLGQLGVYAYQPSPASTTIDLNALDLNAIKASMDKGNLTVKYMRLSWNQTGTTVTDFVFGLVADIKHPLSFVDAWASFPANLVAAFTVLNFTGNDFQLFLLGATQANSSYTWTWEAFSKEYVTYGTIPTDADLSAALEGTGKIGEALAALTAKASENGVTVTIRTYTITTLKAEYLRTESGGYQGVDKDYYRTHLVLTVDFDTDKPVMGSPLGSAITIGIAVAIGVIGLLTGIGILLYLQGLVTYKSEVQQRTVLTNDSDEPQTFVLPDGTTVTVPPHSTYEYSKTESTEGGGASWIAQLPLIIIGIGAIIVAVVVIPPIIRSFRSEKE
ncbi:hypothetical protein MUP77_00375 [Candidatus Bathyarchaeota archaeon]|nr:hypothetical protein [Candidatus Bathyarchaeota archaeon]